MMIRNSRSQPFAKNIVKVAAPNPYREARFLKPGFSVWILYQQHQHRQQNSRQRKIQSLFKNARLWHKHPKRRQHKKEQ
jgi:hypothetical protein